MTDSRRLHTNCSAGWAKWLASVLVKYDVSPNFISVLSILPALIGSWLLACPNSPPHAWKTLLTVALCVQLRLLCNTLDGMMTILGGKQSKVGALYSELPDRIADSLFIVALGYAVFEPWLGWLGALLAAKTAYIRLLGGAIGLAQDFRGPMAQTHRMFVMNLACIIGAAELQFNNSNHALIIATYVIVIGSGITCITRTLAITKQLNAR